MLILTQNRKNIINTSQCTSISIVEGFDDDDTKVTKIYAGTPTANIYNDGYRLLGQYDDESQALEILSEIFNSKGKFIMPDRTSLNFFKKVETL